MHGLLVGWSRRVLITEDYMVLQQLIFYCYSNVNFSYSYKHPLLIAAMVNLRQYLRQRQQKSHLAVKLSGCNVLVAGTGFEPVTFGL